MNAVPVRSKLGYTSKQFKFLSRHKNTLSLLFLGGLAFFALLSLTTHVVPPDSNTGGGSLSWVKGRQRRSLSAGLHAQHISTKQTVAGSLPHIPKLLVATHNRLLWYFPDNDTTQVLHEGQGVHYGMFPGEYHPDGRLKTVWNVIRPHNWHPKTSEEYLVQFDADTGKEVSRVQIASRFTHDAVRSGSRVYLANTDAGEVQELLFPSMKKVRGMPLFTRRQHVNTLAPLGPGELWVVLHNLGQSDLVRVDTAAAAPAAAVRVRSVGAKAHGLVAWRGLLAVLDSEAGALVLADPASGEVHRRWQVPPSEKPSKFLKGLCVVDDVAYFGINVWGRRQIRDSKDNDAELAAVDLASGALLWRRRVPSHGLLNMVAAPQLGEQSTYRAMSSAGGVSASGNASAGGSGSGAAAGKGAAGKGAAAATGSEPGSDAVTFATKSAAGNAVDQGKGKAKQVAAAPTPAPQQGSGGKAGAVKSGINDPRVIAATQQLVAAGYPVKVGGTWASGQPRLDLAAKNSPHSWEAGISLPLMQLNIDKLRDRVLAMPDDMWSTVRQRGENAAVDGRTDNMNKFKPGVDALYMVFSDQSTEHVYRFPYYDYFKDAIEPLLEQIVGREDIGKVVRMQFARMKPGTDIKPHKDMGGYAKFAHRIHLPIVTNPNVTFLVCPAGDASKQAGGRRMAEPGQGDCVAIPMAEGMVFELNNRVTHRVHNASPVNRVQLVVDLAESPRAPRRLRPGTVCQYRNTVMVCPPESIMPDY